MTSQHTAGHVKNMDLVLSIPPFIIIRIFGLLTSSSLLYSQHFSCYVLQPFSIVKLGSPHRISNWTSYLNSRGLDCSNSVNHDWLQVLSYSKYSWLFLPVVGIEPATSRWFHSEILSNQISYPLHHKSEFDMKQLKKAKGHIGRNVSITKMRWKVWISWVISLSFWLEMA